MNEEARKAGGKRMRFWVCMLNEPTLCAGPLASETIISQQMGHLELCS